MEINIYPTIGWNGDVYLLSPELAGVKSEKYNNFVVGNLLHKSFASIIKAGKLASYVSNYQEGVVKCKFECVYFDFCGGGYASNKFFEHGDTNRTETLDCRNSRKRLLDAIIEVS